MKMKRLVFTIDVDVDAIEDGDAQVNQAAQVLASELVQQPGVTEVTVERRNLNGDVEDRGFARRKS
jgi:hypothetical protein